uniref:Uncharacterized protein n=1 Tax=Oryza brachyantha TaxID=4533 RepID=J3KVA9_ORYBR
MSAIGYASTTRRRESSRSLYRHSPHDAIMLLSTRIQQCLYYDPWIGCIWFQDYSGLVGAISFLLMFGSGIIWIGYLDPVTNIPFRCSMGWSPDLAGPIGPR